MPTPVTTLDPRYSDPLAVATPWDETRRVLEKAELFWISTVRADDRPHVTPVVAVWVDEALHFSTGAEEQKYANLRTNPHVVLTTGRNGWDGGLDVVVEGDALRVTDHEVLQHLAAAWEAKWDGRWRFMVRDGCFYNGGSPSHVFRVAPTKVFAHAKGDPFGHTRHKFLSRGGEGGRAAGSDGP